MNVVLECIEISFHLLHEIDIEKLLCSWMRKIWISSLEFSSLLFGSWTNFDKNKNEKNRIIQSTYSLRNMWFFICHTQKKGAHVNKNAIERIVIWSFLQLKIYYTRFAAFHLISDERQNRFFFFTFSKIGESNVCNCDEFAFTETDKNRQTIHVTILSFVFE